MLQCQLPNPEARTCFSLSKIARASPSTYRFTTELLLDAAGPVTATMESIDSVQGTYICETMSAREAARAQIKSDGHPLSATDAARYRATLRAMIAPVSGHRICTQIVTSEDGSLAVIGTLDGKRIPAGDYEMKWVKPSDGWTVAQ